MATMVGIVAPFSEFFPRGGADTVKGNALAHQEISTVSGILLYVIVNPLQPKTFEQARTPIGLMHYFNSR